MSGFDTNDVISDLDFFIYVQNIVEHSLGHKHKIIIDKHNIIMISYSTVRVF